MYGCLSEKRMPKIHENPEVCHAFLFKWPLWIVLGYTAYPVFRQTNTCETKTHVTTMSHVEFAQEPL